MKTTAISLALLVALTACKKETYENQTAGMAAESTMAAPAAMPANTTMAAPGALTDPQIAAIVIAADDVDIKGGEQARTKGTDPQVKDFAQRMITDHTAVNKQVHDLLMKLNATPESNSTSQSMMQQGDQEAMRLMAMSGMSYDTAYINHEVAFHEQVINAVDTNLIPSAQNPELKALLQKTRPVLQEHLDMAKRIQSMPPKS